MDNKYINESLNSNESFLKNKIGESFDIKYRYLKIPVFGDCKAFIVYISSLIDTGIVEGTILESLMSKLPQARRQVKSMEYMSVLMEQGIFTAEANKTNAWNEICDSIMEGDTVLFIDGCPDALILSSRKYEGRSVAEPSTESEVKGPRDGFVENIQINTALIRRRIKDYGLRFDNMKIGERTKTNVLVAYIDGLADEALLKEVKKRLEKIDVDGVIASEYIKELIEDSPLSIFPLITNTERPDKVCAALLEGRIAILVDNTPYILTLPTTFWESLTSSGDYYEKFYLATFIRWVRVIAMFLSISATPLYVMLTSYHQEMLPTALALKIAAGRSGVPFPSFMEAVVMEIILEIMKEAGLRMPKNIAQTVSVVGTLVIGQAAVAAGLVSSLLLITIAVAAISSYAIPSYMMSNIFRLIRFPILIITALFGILGYLAGIIALLIHLMSLRSFGTPYLAPVIPFDKSGNKDVFIRAPRWNFLGRPKFVKSKNSKRQEENLKPKPPSKK